MIQDYIGKKNQPVLMTPGNLQLGQSQQLVRELLGKPYDTNLGFSFLTGSTRMIPISDDGWDRYISTQLTDKFLIRSPKLFLITFNYSIGKSNKIYDEKGRVKLRVSESGSIISIVLKICGDQVPARCGITSIEEILAKGQPRRPSS